jgi:hypothetical protein
LIARAQSYKVRCMSLMKGLSLDSATAEALERLVSQIPDPAVTDYAHATPSFASGGFRINRVANIRVRIGQLVKATEVIDAPLRRLLAWHSLNATVVAPLSVAFLNDHREALASLFGAVPMRIARLLDERDEVREQEAERALPAGEAEAGAEADQARVRKGAVLLRDRLWRLMDTVAAQAADEESGAHPGAAVLAGELQAQQESRLKLAQEELRRLKGIETRAEKLKERLAAHGADLKRAQEALVAAEAAEKRARQAALKAEADLKRNQAQADLQVGSLVEARLAQEFCGWLGGSRIRVAEVAGQMAREVGAEDPLLQRAAAALEAQARADQVSGTRIVLQGRLERLEGVLARCSDALGNAMRPQPPLLAVAEELRAEIEKLRGLLRLETPESLGMVLAAAVNSAPTAKIETWRATVDQLREAGVLGAEAYGELQSTLRLRHAMLGQGALPAEAKPDELDTPRGQLRAVLLGQMAGVVLLDGHNVLFGLQARYRRPQDHVYPDRRAREWLVGDLVRMVANRPTCRVRIIFDGPERSDATASENVGVVYSGGAGEHRADKVIVEEVRFFKQTPLDAVLLVTNDSALAGDAVRLGAMALPPVDLIPFIG